MLATLGNFVLNFLYNKAVDFIASYIRREMKKAEIRKKAQENVIPLRKAQTAEEIDEATDDALDGF